MQHRGQVQLSFSMIFSIILIIATVAVAFYVITHFVRVSDCTKIQLFYQDLDKAAEKVWRSPRAQEAFERDVPSKIEALCFGNPANLGSQYAREAQALRRYSSFDANVFLYPAVRACDSTLTYHKLDHVAIPEAFCVSAEDRTIKITLTKASSSDALVRVQP